MEWLIGTVLLGLIPATIAHMKERNFFLWWLFGAVLLIVALPAAILMGPAKRCFYCDQGIRKAALVCPHCGRKVLSDVEIDALAAEEDEVRPRRHR